MSDLGDKMYEDKMMFEKWIESSPFDNDWQYIVADSLSRIILRMSTEQLIWPNDEWIYLWDKVAISIVEATLKKMKTDLYKLS